MDTINALGHGGKSEPGHFSKSTIEGHARDVRPEEAFCSAKSIPPQCIIFKASLPLSVTLCYFPCAAHASAANARGTAGHSPRYFSQIAKLLPSNSSVTREVAMRCKKSVWRRGCCAEVQSAERAHTKSHVRFEGEGRYTGTGRLRRRGSGKSYTPCTTRFSPLCLHSLCSAGTSHDSHPIFLRTNDDDGDDEESKSQIASLTTLRLVRCQLPPPLLCFLSSRRTAATNVCARHSSFVSGVILAGNES